jgi:pimeloyl-ACP methyl ester carboxylesterase
MPSRFGSARADLRAVPAPADTAAGESADDGVAAAVDGSGAAGDGGGGSAGTEAPAAGARRRTVRAVHDGERAEGDVPDPNLKPGESLRYVTILSPDGTRLNAWTNDAEGPTLLLCNGLGTNPYAWPALLDPDCGVRVISWNHRGVSGSDRPADPRRVGVDAFVEDAVAVLDHFEVDRCVVAGWSVGVNTAFELAVTHPDRVSGLFAVAGVPGGTFASMGAPLMLPRLVRRPIALTVTGALKLSGPAIYPVTSRLPIGRRVAHALSHSGFMLPVPDLDHVARAVGEFLTTPVSWYMHLAQAAARHPRVSLSTIEMPTAFVAGRHDLLASAQDMKTAAARIARATYAELPGSHFVQLEHPGRVHRELLDLLRRVHAPQGA